MSENTASAPEPIKVQSLEAEVQSKLAQASAILGELTKLRDQAVAASSALASAQASAEGSIGKATEAVAGVQAAKKAADELLADLSAKATLAMSAQTTNSVELTKALEEAKQINVDALAAKKQTEAERDKSVVASATAVAANELAGTELAKAKAAAQDTVTAVALVKSEADASNAAAIAAKNSAVEAQTQSELKLKEIGETLAAAAKSKTEAEGFQSIAQTASVEAEKARSKAVAEAKAAAEAHQMSATTGLAGAFNQKAIEARYAQIVWGVALLIALGFIFWVGWDRYQDLKGLLLTKPELSVLGAELLLALFGIGAPTWLAWRSSTLISKNFALGEDYAYKASLAKAYLAFKEQAKGLDPLLEQRLFAAAITQLDANPVRLVDKEHSGSPLQDLLQSEFMRDYLEKNETFKDGLIKWFQQKFGFNKKLPELLNSATTRSPAAASPPASPTS